MGNIEQNNPVNCVLNNVVDKDVQAMLRPLNMTQFILCTPKYRIKNNCITPNKFFFNLLTMIGALTFMSLNVFRGYSLFVYKEEYGFTTFMTVTTFVDCIYYCIGFVNNFVIGIIHTKNNIKFVLLFQRVHRLLNDETSFNRFIMWNWITVIMALGNYFISISYFELSLVLPWYCLFDDFLLVVFDLNVIYAARVLKLLENKLELWNLHVLNSIESEESRGEDFSKRMFQAYVNILECYDIFKVSFQPFILYYIIEAFLHSLIYIQVNIEMFKVCIMNNTTNIGTLGTMSIFCFLMKNLTWQTMFMQRCDSFYLAVLSVRDSCALILKSNCSDDEKKLYKNVLRLHRASFSKMRVCRLFYADAALQLSLMSLLANYTIVLLQFAIL